MRRPTPESLTPHPSANILPRAFPVLVRQNRCRAGDGRASGGVRKGMTPAVPPPEKNLMSIRLIMLLLVLAAGPVSALADGPVEDGRLVHEGVVAAPVKDVWAAFTTKQGQESWMVA